MAVETNHVSRNDIELRAEIGERCECFDAPDCALHSEKLRHFRKHRIVVQVDADRVVTEQATDVEKITGAAADIENPLTRAEVEAEIAHAPEIGVNPTG